MSASKLLRVTGLTLIMLITLVGKAQGGQSTALSSGQIPNEAKVAANIPTQTTTGSTAGALTLGAPGLSFRYVQTFGVTEEAYPADVQHINNPAAVFVDDSDNLFVVEIKGNRVLKYRTSDGANLLSIGKAGLQNRDLYSFDFPNDVAVDSDGNIWVVDNNRVAKYDASGNFLLEFPSADPRAAGSDNDHFNGPRGLAFDSAGRLYSRMPTMSGSRSLIL